MQMHSIVLHTLYLPILFSSRPFNCKKKNESKKNLQFTERWRYLSHLVFLIFFTSPTIRNFRDYMHQTCFQFTDAAEKLDKN